MASYSWGQHLPRLTKKRKTSGSEALFHLNQLSHPVEMCKCAKAVRLRQLSHSRLVRKHSWSWSLSGGTTPCCIAAKIHQPRLFLMAPAALPTKLPPLLSWPRVTCQGARHFATDLVPRSTDRSSPQNELPVFVGARHFVVCQRVGSSDLAQHPFDLMLMIDTRGEIGEVAKRWTSSKGCW